MRVVASRRERVRQALAGEAVDRPPFAVWHHFRPQGSPQALAAATVAFCTDVGCDVFKVMPDLPYPLPPPLTADATRWPELPRLSADPTGPLGGMPEAVRLVREAAPDEVVWMTVFSPLALALRLAGGGPSLLRWASREPEAVHAALAVFADNLAAQCAAGLRAGADGIYFATAGQGDGIMPEEAYRLLGRPYDLRVLAACDRGWCNVLHMHAERSLHWRLTLDYPVQVFSWSDRRTGIGLEEVAHALPGKTVMGGLDETGAVVRGDEAGLWAEVRDAHTRVAGSRLILAGGCSVPDDTPLSHLRLARELVDRLALPSA
jgi:uroporphyrinogen decarboxylase